MTANMIWIQYDGRDEGKDQRSRIRFTIVASVFFLSD